MALSFSKISDEAVAELRSRIGKPVQRVTLATFTEINADAARHFAYAIGDNNPLWLDPDYAAATRWQTRLAPAAILYSTDNVASGAVEGLPGVRFSRSVPPSSSTSPARSWRRRIPSPAERADPAA